ncbi:hypothetical protein EYF80_021347 [Liparis tanakae]|uniref:Uncharacterized protein n=1 Tax=Liparis tanakae TaxID=230148 RepID=A0A4Z2HRE7_9TELE|nr:hypothetical protein EYF80_021347 [Liparis tanakae]
MRWVLEVDVAPIQHSSLQTGFQNLSTFWSQRFPTFGIAPSPGCHGTPLAKGQRAQGCCGEQRGLSPWRWPHGIEVLKSGFRDFQPPAISEALTWRPDSHLKGAGRGRGCGLSAIHQQVSPHGAHTVHKQAHSTRDRSHAHSSGMYT